ncbi:hypothetical protein C8R43DRAFT_419636 [Mycena crocata]|nr:hypothetical protein C8R43DRAFT_419636 [Mycena crocata]
MNQQPETVQLSAKESVCANCLVLVNGLQGWLFADSAPPSSHIPSIARNAKVADQRQHGIWPITTIFKRAPTKHSTDPSLVLVCELCAKAAVDNQLARRTVSAASFVPKPPQLEDLEIGERAMIRKLTGINLDTMTAAASQLKEGMVFPDLYPLGCGWWIKGEGSLSRSFEEDMQIKLNSVDARWRKDKEWPDWAAAVAGAADIPTKKGKVRVVDQGFRAS